MSLMRAIATVSGWTMLSRVLGFIRDMLLAHILGAGLVADAFFIAFKFPNLFRRLFGEGAMNAAFVPIYAGKVEREGSEEARLFASFVGSSLMMFMILLTVLAIIFMPAIMLVQARGFVDQPDKFALTVDLARITFPYLFFMVLAAILSGMLNSVNRFVAAAAAPVLLNIVLITALILVHFEHLKDPGLGMAYAVAFAGFLQAGLLVWSAKRAGIMFRVTRPRFTPDVKKLLLLLGPGILGAGVIQINVMIGDILATLLAEGSVSYLYYADRINQLPLGVIGVAVGIALLPAISRQVKAGDEAGANHSMNRAIEFSMIMTLPAAVALMVMPDMIVLTLFNRGAFDVTASRQTAIALQAFAIGLPAYVLVKALAPGFFAREDTKSPVKVAMVVMTLNAILAYILMQYMAHQGIALAASITAWLNVSLLYILLRRRGLYRGDRRLLRILVKACIAAILMGAVLLGLRFLMAKNTAGFVFADGLERIAILAVFILAGMAAYGIFIMALKVTTPSELRNALRRSGKA